MIAAAEIPTQAAAEPVSSVALIMTSSTPASRNLGHQRVRRVRVSGAALRRAGLPAGTAGKPRGPGTGGAAALSLSRRRDHRVICAVQQLSGPATRPKLRADASPSSPGRGEDQRRAGHGRTAGCLANVERLMRRPARAAASPERPASRHPHKRPARRPWVRAERRGECSMSGGYLGATGSIRPSGRLPFVPPGPRAVRLHGRVGVLHPAGLPEPAPPRGPRVHLLTARGPGPAEGGSPLARAFPP